MNNKASRDPKMTVRTTRRVEYRGWHVEGSRFDVIVTRDGSRGIVSALGESDVVSLRDALNEYIRHEISDTQEQP